MGKKNSLLERIFNIQSHNFLDRQISGIGSSIYPLIENWDVLFLINPEKLSQIDIKLFDDIENEGVLKYRAKYISHVIKTGNEICKESDSEKILNKSDSAIEEKKNKLKLIENHVKNYFRSPFPPLNGAEGDSMDILSKSVTQSRHKLNTLNERKAQLAKIAINTNEKNFFELEDTLREKYQPIEFPIREENNCLIATPPNLEMDSLVIQSQNGPLSFDANSCIPPSFLYYLFSGNLNISILDFAITSPGKLHEEIS